MSSSSSNTSWAINVDKCVTSSGPGIYNVNDPSIYKIPEHIAGENRKLYQPQLVPLGPHHDREPYSNIVIVKDNAALQFIDRLKVSSDHDDYYQIVHRQSILLIRPYYDDLGIKFDGKEWDPMFTRNMVTDGVFILEMLRLGTSDHPKDNRNPFYELLTSIENSSVVPIIKQDILLLENQVPFWLLEFLLFSCDPHTDPEKLLHFKLGYQTGKLEELLDLIIKCYSLPESTRKLKPPYLHILDIYRRGLISQDIHRDETKIKTYVYDETAQYFPSASKLYEAAIPFEKSLTADLKDVSYHHGTLRLPPILITKDTVRTFANMMAFEKLHIGAGNDITSYVFVLNCLIHNARDVSLLESHGVIQHTLRDDEDVVKSLALISKDVAYPPDNMLMDIQIVSQQLKARRFRKRLNVWRLDLLEKYLNTPWGALSVIGAILLFTLSIIQTVYAVLSYIHRK